MAHLYIPAKGSIDGPWLLGIEELESLDKVLDTIEQKLAEAAEAQIQEQAALEVSKGEFPTLYPDIETALKRVREKYSKPLASYYKKERIIKIITSDGKELSDSKLVNIIRDSKSRDLSPKTLSIEVDNIGNVFKLNVDSRYDGGLLYSAKCTSQSFEDDIVYEVGLWIDKYKPNKAQQLLLAYWFPLAWVFFCVSVYAALHIVSYIKYDYKEGYLTELNTILTQGINEANQKKAIELYIKYSIDYTPINNKIKETRVINSDYTRTSIIFSLIFILLFLRPRTTIGLGGNKNLIKWYRFYTKLVFTIIPTSILLPPLFSLIRQAIGLK